MATAQLPGHAGRVPIDGDSVAQRRPARSDADWWRLIRRALRPLGLVVGIGAVAPTLFGGGSLGLNALTVLFLVVGWSFIASGLVGWPRRPENHVGGQSVDVEGRLPDPVEVAAYYLVSEGLTNVAKYAQTSAATVEVARTNGQVIVQVADDGVGGADPSSGSGLRGLADRIETLGGRLRVRSPNGRGTSVRAEIPCG